MPTYTFKSPYTPDQLDHIAWALSFAHSSQVFRDSESRVHGQEVLNKVREERDLLENLEARCGGADG